MLAIHKAHPIKALLQDVGGARGRVLLHDDLAADVVRVAGHGPLLANGGRRRDQEHQNNGRDGPRMHIRAHHTGTVLPSQSRCGVVVVERHAHVAPAQCRAQYCHNNGNASLLLMRRHIILLLYTRSIIKLLLLNTASRRVLIGCMMMGHIISHYSSKSLLVLAMFLLNHLGVRDGCTLASSHP